MTFGLSSLLGLSSNASWRDGYVKASFRGVEFFIKSSTVKNGGRKIVKHEFPEKDETHNEDLGKKNYDFALSAYLIGDEYFNHRNDLEDALNEKGPGILIHPYRGEISVVVPDFNLSEISEEGRMCRFEIEFCNDEVVALTVLGPGPYDLLNDAINAFQVAALTLMDDVYDIANAPNAILDDIAAIVQVGLTIVDSAKGVMDTDDVFRRNIEDLQNNTEELMSSPTVLVSEIQELIAYGTDVTDVNNSLYVSDAAGLELFSGMRGLTEFQDTSYSAFPSITDVDGEPAKEMAKFISRVALGSRIGLLSTMTINNASHADQIMTELDTTIKSIEEDELVSDDFYEAARDLRVAMRGVIKERKLDLKELTEVELSEFATGISLAYELYQDPSRDEEIAELNGILHPGFLPSGPLVINES